MLLLVAYDSKGDNMSKSDFKAFLGGKVDTFSRGTFQQLTFLIIFSPLFTSMFKEKVLLYAIFVLLITISNLGVEYFAITKKGPSPKNYIGLFLLISLPINIIILLIFYIMP